MRALILQCSVAHYKALEVLLGKSLYFRPLLSHEDFALPGTRVQFSVLCTLTPRLCWVLNEQVNEWLHLAGDGMSTHVSPSGCSLFSVDSDAGKIWEVI